MRKIIIAGNWKMNKTPSAAKTLISSMIPLVSDCICDVVICPPAIDIPVAAEAIKGTNIHLGAQNLHWAENGAFTGEISADMLSEYGVEYVIVGHSERRGYFGETDETVNKRALFALSKGLIPIICVGETLEQYESNETSAVVTRQITAALNGMSAEQVSGLVVAYEPVWAIGTGKTATPQVADSTIGVIRTAIAKLFGSSVAEEVRIQYGGSMNDANAKDLLGMENIDGGLIGGAALVAEKFAAICNAVK